MTLAKCVHLLYLSWGQQDVRSLSLVLPLACGIPPRPHPLLPPLSPSHLPPSSLSSLPLSLFPLMTKTALSVPAVKRTYLNKVTR